MYDNNDWPNDTDAREAYETLCRRTAGGIATEMRNRTYRPATNMSNEDLRCLFIKISMDPEAANIYVNLVEELIGVVTPLASTQAVTFVRLAELHHMRDKLFKSTLELSQSQAVDADYALLLLCGMRINWTGNPWREDKDGISALTELFTEELIGLMDPMDCYHAILRAMAYAQTNLFVLVDRSYHCGTIQQVLSILDTSAYMGTRVTNPTHYQARLILLRLRHAIESVPSSDSDTEDRLLTIMGLILYFLDRLPPVQYRRFVCELRELVE